MSSLLIIRVFKIYSGTMNPGVLIKKLHSGIHAKGGLVQYNSAVTSISHNENSILLEVEKDGKKEEKEFDKLVIAAGPYSLNLLNDLSKDMSELLDIRRLFLAFFKVNEVQYKSLSEERKKILVESFPVAQLDDVIYYSMIEKFEDGIPIIKVGGHFLRDEITNLDEVWHLDLKNSEI